MGKKFDFVLPGIDDQKMMEKEEAARRAKRRRLLLVCGIIFLLILVAIVVALAVLIPRFVRPPVRECIRKKFDSTMDSFVCVCTADHCDEIEEIGDLEGNQLVYFLTSRDEHRLKRFAVDEGNPLEKSGGIDVLEVRVNDSETFQSVFGFGAAFTDAVGILLNSLNAQAREQLLRAYFDKQNGIRYTLARTPIASTDFSTRIYSYLDVPNDFDAKNFGLTSEDVDLKIPYLIAAREMAGEQFRMCASSWSPPWWMKASEKMQGGGVMKGKMGGDDSYYRAFAIYLRLFFEEYAKRGIRFWAMTLGNEPAVDRDDWWQAVFMDPETQREFAYQLLAPELAKSNVTKDLLIIAHDDQRDRVASAAKILYENDTKAEVIAGLGVHWYSFSNYTVLQEAHELGTDKFILGAEACTGDQGNGEFHGPQLGNWTRGWMYGHDIINSMQRWMVGWIDWNLCLDMQGGPSWYQNTIDSPIIVNAEKQEFYKQPMFYFLAHFSRFVPVHSTHITSKMFTNDGVEVEAEDAFFLKKAGPLEHIAFNSPDGQIVLVLLNGDAAKERIVRVVHGGRQWHIALPADSIATAIWQRS